MHQMVHDFAFLAGLASTFALPDLLAVTSNIGTLRCGSALPFESV